MWHFFAKTKFIHSLWRPQIDINNYLVEKNHLNQNTAFIFGSRQNQNVHDRLEKGIAV